MTQRSDFSAIEADQQIGSVSDKSASETATRNKRSVRIAVSLPVEIRDKFGGKDQTRTQFVLLRGCALTTKLPVRIGNKLSLQNLKSSRSAECHAISVEPGLNGTHQVEIEFISPQADFWPVQFPAEESRVLGPAPTPQQSQFDSEPRRNQGSRASDKDLLLLADSVAEDFAVSKIHSPERVVARVATVDSVAQFRAANRAAHRREQRRKAIFSALFFAALSGAGLGARYWLIHKPQALEAAPSPELRSIAQKLARAIPVKASNATQASAVASVPSDSTPPADIQVAPSTVAPAPNPTAAANPQLAAVPSQSASSQAPQISGDVTQPDAPVSIHHGSTLAAIRKSKAADPGEEPVALPLRVAETASLAKPEVLKDVVADVPTQPAVLAAEVPKKAVPARLTHSVPAQYPAMARQLRVEGEVLLDVNVDAAGAVSDIKAVSGPPLLRAAAIDCVKRWKYQPATLGDKPVASTEVVKVDFRWR